MGEPRRLKALWASTACYRDDVTFYLFMPVLSDPDTLLKVISVSIVKAETYMTQIGLKLRMPAFGYS
jgi:hypothetical protein